MTVNMGALSKKMTFALLVVACATALAWHGTILPEKWEEIVKWVGIAYIAAQGAVDVAKARK